MVQVGDLIPIGKSDDNIAPPPITNFKVDEFGDGYVNLSWSNPDDTDFVGVKIQRKTGGYPVSENDGTTVYDGAGTALSDNGLANNITYYYRAFTYDFDDNFNTDTGQQVSDTPTSADDTSGSPGSPNLIAGDLSAGYYGTVPYSQLISGDALASEIGLTAGTSQHSTVEWLKFSTNGKPMFSPMKPIRHTLSWDDINAIDAVYGDKIVTIGGLSYKLRLWRGAENDPSNYTDADRDAIGSEWNKLMLPIHVNAPNSWAYPAYGGTSEDWGINFTDDDLLTHRDYGDGSYVWCQETRGNDTSGRVLRGSNGVSGSASLTASNAGSYYGWRPVLELL